MHPPNVCLVRGLWHTDFAIDVLLKSKKVALKGSQKLPFFIGQPLRGFLLQFTLFCGL